MTDQANTQPIKPVPARAARKQSNTTQHKVISATLAGAACVGLVGVIGVRVATDANASQNKKSVDAATLAAATSSTGMTQDQLDQYAAKLEAERQKLIAYRDQLVQVANVLQSRAGAATGVQQTALTQAAPKVTKTSAQASKKSKKAARRAAAARAAAQAQAQAQAQSQVQTQQQAPQRAQAPQLQPQRQYQQMPQSNTRGS